MTSRKRIWLAGLSCFLMIVGLCLAAAPGKISVKLGHELEQKLTENGITAQYHFDGRDVIFTGDVSVNYNRSAQFGLAREVAGIRNIIDRQVLFEPQPAFGQILIENGQVKFTGGFKNPANLERITKLIYQYFPEYEIIVEAQASDRMITMQQILDYEYLFERFQGNEVWFEFSDRRVIMNGRFKSEHDRELAEQKILSRISKQTRYINDIKITGAEKSETIVFKKLAGGAISVSGVLADTLLKEKLTALFKGYYPGTELQLDISVNEGLEFVAWHDQIGYLIPELDRIIEGEFRFYLDEVVLEGSVEDLSTKAGLLSRIDEAVEGLNIIDRLVID